MTDEARPPSALTSRIVSGGVRILAIVVTIFLSVIYLKLGYFMLFLLPAGALAAILLTRKQRAGYRPVLSWLVVIVAYCAATVLVSFAVNQNRDEARDLTWEIIEVPGQSTAPEIRLYLAEDHYLSSHSAELGRYLHSRGNRTVPVLLPVSSTLGCLQGFGNPRIEGWGEVPVSAYTSGSGAGPWEQHWWCP